MIRYEFGDAPESEKAVVRKAFEHIASIAPIYHDVTIRYPCELEKQYDIYSNKITGFVEARTNPDGNLIEVSPLTLNPPKDSESVPKDPNIVLMPTNEQLPAIDFVAAHEWGHLVLFPIRKQLITSLSRKQIVFDILFGDSMSSYGKTSPDEALAEAFAEWHLSKGKTENHITQDIAKLAGWRREF